MRFVDTDVLLYAVSRDPEERDKAARANEIHRGKPPPSGCAVVLSEDLSDEQDYGGVRVENPFHPNN